MRDAAPGLIAKIGTHKPLVACFVGKVIWDNVEPYLVRMYKEKEKHPRKQPFSYDLQPYKLVYSKDVPKGSSARLPIPVTVIDGVRDRIDPRDPILCRPEHIR